MEVITRKTTKSEAKKLYTKLMQKDNDALKGKKNNDVRKYNILDIQNNVGPIFTTGTSFHYRGVSKETEFERSIGR